MTPVSERHIALQFGHIRHFNEGLSEVSRQLATQFATQAESLRATRGVRFHFILPTQWHGIFGTAVQYHALQESMRGSHRFPIDLDVWHGLHQHMRYRSPINARRQVITVHDLNHIYAKTGLSLWWQNFRLTRHLQRADQLVAISHHAANDLSRHVHGMPPVTVIHNGVADLSGQPQEAIGALEGQRFLLHVSRMSPSKNVGALIEMAACWPEQQLVLVGPQSPEVAAHRARVQELGLRNVVFFNDVKETQKAWLYAHCSAFLFPSLMEGFGLPPVEAMYFGVPVIVARRTSLPEVCGDGAAYWDDFVPVNMRRVVEARIQAHHDQPALQDRVRGQALRYSWSRAALAYMAVYGA